MSPRVGVDWMVHIESLLRIFRRAFNWLHCSPGKGDLKASQKQDMPSIYCGAILFTIEVKGYLLFVVREDRG
jgi:hypothetical protein